MPVSPDNVFSWRQALGALARPGRPPTRWVASAFVMLGLGLGTITVIIWLGLAWHDNPAKYFGERKAGTYASFAALLGSAFICSRMARRTAGTAVARFWWIAAAGFVWMGLDDLFVFHERADRPVYALLGWDPEDPLTDHIDDAIVAGYGLAAVALAFRYRHYLVRLRWMVLTMGVAFACFTTMVVVDWTHASKAVEDAFKLLAGTLIVIGFLGAYFDPDTGGG